jgi:transcriptional pleiotropic regulator of transition state genes
MKATGIVRRIDDLGRVVLPKELRRTLGINEQDEMEIFVDKDSIIIKKYAIKCAICDESETEELKFKNSVCICKKCIRELNKSL